MAELQLLTVADVAERLRLAEGTVRRHAREGRLRSVRLGRQLRFEESAVRAFVARSRSGDPEPHPANGPQIRALHATCRDLWLVTGGDQLEWKRKALDAATSHFGHEIVSAGELRSLEASWIIDWLKTELARAKLVEAERTLRLHD